MCYKLKKEVAVGKSNSKNQKWMVRCRLGVHVNEFIPLYIMTVLVMLEGAILFIYSSKRIDLSYIYVH